MPLFIILILLTLVALRDFWYIILAALGVILLLGFVYFIIQARPPKPVEKKSSAPKKLPPKFKKKEGQLLASSMTEEGLWYVIDPEQVTCTCPDWIKRRSGEPLHLPSRVCKHLAKYYENRAKKTPALLQPWRRVIRMVAEHDLGVPISNVIFFIAEGGEHVMIDFYYYPKSGWINVYIDYFEYGYNPAEKRWSYKREPTNVHILLRIIYDYLAGNIPDGSNEYHLDNV